MMGALVIVVCDVCGHTGRYKSRGLADHHFPRHSCDKWLAHADAVQAALAREARIDRTPKPCHHPEANHEHGHYATYTLDGCRCLPCTTATARYNSDLARRHAYGQRPYVDAQPAREHVEALREAGVGLKTLAVRAGVSHGALSKLMYGHPRPDGTRREPSRRIAADTARRILAVPPVAAVAADGGRIDSTGTRRRLEALATLGWSVQRLADRAGVDRQAFDAALAGRDVTARTARTVARLYDALWAAPAPEASKTDKIAAARTRRRAQQHKWAPPMAWDDDTIDDPAAVPDLGDRARGADLDEWLYLVECGELLEVASSRLGTTVEAVRQAAKRAGRTDVLNVITEAGRARRAAREHTIPIRTDSQRYLDARKGAA